MCVTQDQAAMLPSAIWNCELSLPNTNDAASTIEEQVDEAISRHDHHRVKEFSFPHHSLNKYHKLRSSKVDPGFCDPESPLSLSGYMDVTGSQYDTKHDKHYFFWFFEAREAHNPYEKEVEQQSNSETPLIIWLTGGPGCSSTLALLTENGK